MSATPEHAGRHVALRWLYGFLGRERRGALALGGLALATTALTLAQPWLTQRIIDDGLVARHRAALITYAKQMSQFVGKQNVRVNAISPDPIYFEGGAAGK